MDIKIKFTGDEQKPAEEQKPQATIQLNIRKTLDGNLIVRDHPLIDIIVMPKTNKILALSKNSMGDRTYYAQNKLFDYLYKRGIVDPASIQAGNIYASMEATIPAPVENINPIQTAVFGIFKFLQEELPIFAYEKQLDHMQDQETTEPDSEHSTELGEVPHKDKKGVLGQSVYSPQYAYNYMYFGE
jgi:hypothetical protein